MLKKSLSLILALVTALALLPAIPAMAADSQKVNYDGHQYQIVETGMSWTDAEAYCENLGGHLATITSQGEQDFIKGLIEQGTKNYYWLGGYCEADRVFQWITDEPMDFTAWATGEPNNYQGKQDKIMMYRLPNPSNSGSSQYLWDDIRDEGTVDGEPFFSETSFGFICEWENIASGWAQLELLTADYLGLVPASLAGADLTQPITRAEFAAVSVKAYENLTGKATAPAASNPFADTADPEVLKAYNVGITAGTSATTFDPNTILNREQAATMLTRVLKAAYIPGWTLAADGNFTLNFKQPAPFADDANISDWAKPSVYFMAANGIIAGTGNGMFSPKATTTEEQAAGYANATREQAIVIASRMVENLKDKPLDYGNGQQSSAPAQSGLTLAALKQAAKDAGYEVSDDYVASILAPVDPVNGFTVTFTVGGEFDLQFFEFASEADAQAYKTSRDAPNDLFPEEYIIHGRFLGEVVGGFGAATDASIRAFVVSVFAAAMK